MGTGAIISSPRVGVPSITAWLTRHRRRLAQVALVVLLLGGATLTVTGLVNRFSEEEQLYREYYAYYYGHLIKSQAPLEAGRLADTYARHYARYYTSDGYRLSLATMLPEASTASLSYPANSPNAQQRITSQGVMLIKSFESFRAEPYLDSGGTLTIGYGHLVRKHQPTLRLTPQQAETLLIQDVRVAEAVVKRDVKVKLTPSQFSALVSLVYNIGPTAFSESTMLKKLNQRQFSAATREFARWKYIDSKHSKGLSRRRLAEEWMFKGYYAA